LTTEIEEKGILNDTQNGYRKGRSAIDNIYVINTAVEAELKKDKGKLYAFFSDLKAAFDTVDRSLLYDKMKKLGIREEQINAIRNIYNETSNVVKINNLTSEPFWITVGLKQGCPLSPILFALYTADLENVMQKGQAGGAIIGRKKVYTYYLLPMIL